MQRTSAGFKSGTSSTPFSSLNGKVKQPTTQGGAGSEQDNTDPDNDTDYTDDYDPDDDPDSAKNQGYSDH